MFNVSCIQLTSDNNVFSNLEKTTDLIIGSIKKKADLIITPENTSLFTFDHSELLEILLTDSKKKLLFISSAF